MCWNQISTSEKKNWIIEKFYWKFLIIKHFFNLVINFKKQHCNNRESGVISTVGTRIIRYLHLFFLLDIYCFYQLVYNIKESPQTIFLFIEFIEETLVNRIVQVSGAQFHHTSSVPLLCVTHPKSSLSASPLIPPRVPLPPSPTLLTLAVITLLSYPWVGSFLLIFCSFPPTPKPFNPPAPAIPTSYYTQKLIQRGAYTSLQKLNP